MWILPAFAAGSTATLVFHQLTLALLYEAGLSERAPYAVEPTLPFGLPAVVSLAFWGGAWGIPLWMLIRKRAGRAGYWLLALVFGAVAPTLVAGLVVAPLEGQPLAGGGEPAAILVGLLVNAAWGIGTALLLWPLTRPPRPYGTLALVLAATLLAAGCAAGPPAERDGAPAADGEISRERAIEIARRHADLDFEVREVTAERAVEQGRDVWRVTFRGDPPGPGHPLGHLQVVSLDRRTGELVSVAMS